MSISRFFLRSFCVFSWQLHFVILFMAVSSVYVFRGQEAVSNEPLTSTTGTIENVTYGRGKGLSVVLKVSTEPDRYKELYADSSRVEMLSDLKGFRGREVTFYHYGRLIDSCMIGGIQVCVSHCVSDEQCIEKGRESSSRAFCWLIGAVFVFYFSVFLYSFRKEN